MCIRDRPKTLPVVPGQLTLRRANPHPAVKAVGCAKGSTTKVGWQGRRPADGDVTPRGVARRLICCCRSQSACEKRATESSNCNIAASSRASKLAGAGGVSPGGGVSRKRGVPTGSAPTRSDGIGTVETDEAVGAGVAAVGGPGHGRGIGGGVLAPLAVGRGVPPGPKP